MNFLSVPNLVRLSNSLDSPLSLTAGLPSWLLHLIEDSWLFLGLVGSGISIRCFLASDMIKVVARTNHYKKIHFQCQKNLSPKVVILSPKVLGKNMSYYPVCHDKPVSKNFTCLWLSASWMNFNFVTTH